MERIVTGASLALLSCALVIMCLPTWRASWERSGGTVGHTYQRWFAAPIGFFDMVAPVTMLLTITLMITVLVSFLTRRIRWLTVAIGLAGTVLLTSFGYSDQAASRAIGAGIWVAPLLGLATLLLVIGKLLPRLKERAGQISW